MCSYDPKNQKYAGDEKMRIVSKMTNKMRQKRKSSDTVKAPSDGSGNLTFDQYRDLLRSRRVCNDLCRYENHLNCITPHKSPAKCAVCGEMAYKRCNICNAALHNMDTKGIGKGRNCALQWHNEAYLGLCLKIESFWVSRQKTGRCGVDTKQRKMQGASRDTQMH